MNVVRRTAPLVGLCLVLAACGASTAASGAATGAAAASTASGGASVPSAGRCPSGPSQPFDVTTSGHQPSDAVPLGPDDTVVAVVRCDLAEQEFPGEGGWKVVTSSRATTGLEPLLVALRRPAETGRPGGCLDYLLAEPWFGLELADGRFVRPIVPLDSCGHPLAEVGAALDALPWRTGDTARYEQTRTQEQVDLAARADAIGCPAAIKDLAAIEVESGRAPRPGTRGDVALPEGSVLLCRYRVGTAPYDPTAPGFVSGERLPVAGAAAVRSALDASGPVLACSQPHRDLAMLLVGDSWTEVELDGCRRVLGWTSQWAQAAPALLAALR